MPLAVDVKILGGDGDWRIFPVGLAFANKGKKRMRCVDCRGHIKLHDAAKDGSMAAHVEHATRWAGCPRSQAYDGNGIRPHPNRVPDL